MGLRVDLPNIAAVLEQIAVPTARIANGAVAATAVDRAKYRGRGMARLKATGGTGTAPTLDVTIEHSDDNITFATVGSTVVPTGFTQVGASASVQTININLDAAKRYIRAKATIAGAAGAGFVRTVDFIFPAGPDVPAPA